MRRFAAWNWRTGIKIVKPSTSGVIAKREPSALGVPGAPAHGARGLLATPAGAVACELEPVGIDEAGARYELRVTNGTAGVLAATVSAVRVDEGRPVAALAIEIQPHAAIRTGFALDPSLAYERVAAEVRGDGIHLVIEAPPPLGGKPRRRWIAPVIAVGVAGLLAGTTLIVFGAQRPRVVAAALLASPDGRLVARWSTTGLGNRRYELRDAGGNVVAQGPLPEADGTLDLGRADAASLHVAIGNAFGSDTRDAAYARATAPPAIRIVSTPPPRIASISIAPQQAGAPLTVRYAAHARDLRLAILDRDGKVYFATKTPSGNGEIQVPAPPAGAREPYQLVAKAEGAGAGQEMRVPLAVAVAVSPSPSASPAGSSPGPAPAAAAATGPVSRSVVVDAGGSDSFVMRPERVRPGDTFVVEIPFADGARVDIIRNRDGLELAGADLKPGERSVSLTAPARERQCTVRVTIQRGAGLVTIVRPLRFAGS